MCSPSRPDIASVLVCTYWRHAHDCGFDILGGLCGLRLEPSRP